MSDLSDEIKVQEWVMKTPDGLYLTLLTPVKVDL